MLLVLSDILHAHDNRSGYDASCMAEGCHVRCMKTESGCGVVPIEGLLGVSLDSFHYKLVRILVYSMTYTCPLSDKSD